jgi:hypothetical protein
LSAARKETDSIAPFHQTDRIDFKEGYLNRRINITMRDGRRDAAAKAN